jgi:hypothetical protein
MNDNQANKPTFLSKAERKALALQQRIDEVEKLKKAQEEERILRESFFKGNISLILFLFSISNVEMMTVTDTSDRCL